MIDDEMGGSGLTITMGATNLSEAIDDLLEAADELRDKVTAYLNRRHLRKAQRPTEADLREALGKLADAEDYLEEIRNAG